MNFFPFFIIKIHTHTHHPSIRHTHTHTEKIYKWNSKICRQLFAADVNAEWETDTNAHDGESRLRHHSTLAPILMSSLFMRSVFNLDSISSTLNDDNGTFSIVFHLDCIVSWWESVRYWFRIIFSPSSMIHTSIWQIFSMIYYGITFK